jgi:multisubunit Na+/H+ antiporter MnhE subunit
MSLLCVILLRNCLSQESLKMLRVFRMLFLVMAFLNSLLETNISLLFTL